MKKLNLLLIALFAMSFIIFSACSEDEDPVQAPTITVTPNADTLKVNVGDFVDYAISWSANPLLSAKISYAIGNTSQIIFDTTFAGGVNSFNFNVQLEITDAIPVGALIKLMFVGITSDQVSTTVEKYILIESGMDTFTGVVLQAQADGPNTAATNLSFYSSTMNERYTLNQSANADTASYIDLVFTHHAIFKTNEELSFQSPNSPNLHQMWAELPGFNPPYDYVVSDKNQTYFKKLDNVIPIFGVNNITYFALLQRKRHIFKGLTVKFDTLASRKIACFSTPFICSCII